MQKGNVIFIHPDGTSPSHWGAARFLHYGADGRLNWDQMEHMAIYLGHMKNQLTGTSNAGAVTHATGVKVRADSFGLDEAGQPVTAASGKQETIMQAAIAQGYGTALINSGIISEPGTGAFVAKVKNRRENAEITKQILESGVDVILGGGEVWYLPKGTAGRYAKASQSQREDGVNLIELAKQKGYTIVYSREELLALPNTTTKILGIFAAEDTYNDISEEELKKQILPIYELRAPTVAEMLEVALQRMTQKGKPFFVVLEEEGTDNFSNANNARGSLEAAKRADDAIGLAMKHIAQNPNTLLLTAADSDAGGLEVMGEELGEMQINQKLSATNKNGAALDGKDGTSSVPFLSAPDANGQRLPFAIVWSGFNDNAGAIVAKAHGLNASQLRGTIDNTEIYRLMYGTLFGTLPSRSQ
ncbi:MAG: alkaline phosphatase [Leptolyngbyaceae cyanobacterium bins.302]|nr:alkaline phosphatase [Leptolyngbyaceae cyanobacterium bins.302]